MLQAGKLDKLQNRMASRGELEIGESQHGVEEGMLDGSDGIDSPVASAILRRILMQRTDLLAKHGPEKVSNAIGDVAEFVGDVDEIGSSDVSGWIKQIEQSLSGVDEGILDTVKKVGGKVLDKLGHGSDEDLLKDLQKKAGVRGPNHGKPSMAQSDVEKRTDEVDMGQADSSLRSEPKQDNGKMDHFTALGKASKKMGHNHYMDVPDDKLEALKAMVKRFRAGEEVDESALQAYIGDKKYGKDGMDALRKAGQDDASEKTMHTIRAKYSSKEEVAEGLDPEKKARLNDLIDAYTDATDPEYMGDDDYEDIIAQIRAEFGDRTADSIVNGPSMHFPRPGHSMGHDDLEFKQMRKNMSPNRMTKLGKLHKQDSDAMKRDIKSKLEVDESEFAGDYATGEAGQWRNKGPKANKPATVGDLVGEGKEDLAAMMRIVNR
jgi:hypothetical protein